MTEDMLLTQTDDDGDSMDEPTRRQVAKVQQEHHTTAIDRQARESRIGQTPAGRRFLDAHRRITDPYQPDDHE